jgi:hypothetical protein
MASQHRRLPKAPQRPAPSPLETLIGRSLAGLLHPSLAWRAYSTPHRVLLVLGYSAVGYVAVLATLLASNL